jgi:hypothetical protein
MCGKPVQSLGFSRKVFSKKAQKSNEKAAAAL